MFTQHGADVGQPALDGTVGGGEQVVVPAGGTNPGPVTGGGGQPAVGPRHPGELGFHLRQLFQQRVVVGHLHLRGQRRDVIGPAHHRDLLVGAFRRSQRLAHVCLAQQGLLVVATVLADCGHGLCDHIEDVLVALLDEVLPPTFRIVVPGGLGQQAQRIRFHRAFLPGAGEAERAGKVDERRGPGVAGGPVEGLPFG